MSTLFPDVHSSTSPSGTDVDPATSIALEFSQSPTPQELDALLRREWHLTNGLGGFAMGTPLGIPTRRYHGLLVGALQPPVGRVMGLSRFVETLCLQPAQSGKGPLASSPPVPVIKPGDARPGEQRVDFCAFAFPNSIHPTGHTLLRKFERDVSCRWHYQYGPVRFSREVVLVRHRNEALIRYRISGHTPGTRLELRPLVALRDFHELLSSKNRVTFAVLAGQDNAEIVRDRFRLRVACDRGCFVQDREWWYNFEYARDRERGQDCTEDLFSPGRFVIELPSDQNPAPETLVELRATLSLDGPIFSPASVPTSVTFREAVSAEAARLAAISSRVVSAVRARRALNADEERTLATLTAAADQFVVLRDMPQSPPSTADSVAAPAAVAHMPARSTTVIAGYPWFSDWGRDTMIALPGLMLATGRLDEAGQALETFATLTRKGLVPNCFDNGSGMAEYNTVDASLWYLHAAATYRRTAMQAGQRDPVSETSPIRRACLAIIDAYLHGTDYHIRVDPADGLVAAGDPGTQLTWMDAKRDGVVFTPRHGKPVEINALWYSGLLEIAELVEPDRPRTARELRQHAHVVARSFREKFWNSRESCLFDVLSPGTNGNWLPVADIRPNQIFAVSLPHSPLTEPQQEGVLRTAREHLLTPMGLRTLSPRDKKYTGRFQGTLFERDRAYHNGTVWPWLLGPYASAILKVGKGSARAAAEARNAIEPLAREVHGQFLGQLAEIYDGDHSDHMPQRADGCSAQAWSVAECLRVFIEIAST